ncbi:MAG: XrtA/PEP-CTERM system TPR-repeat protein PrsT, partial [Rubrivivax sp.]
VRTSAAMAQMAGSNSSAAVDELAAIAAAGSGPRTDLALISGRLRQNDMPGALKAIDGLQKKLPDSPLPDNLRGRVMLLKKDVAAARTSFEAALVKDPTYFPALASLAAIEAQEGKPELARKRLEALLKVQPKNYRAMLALAELGARTGASVEETLKLLRDATKVDPSAPEPHLLYINRSLAGGDYKAALVAAQDATAAAPNSFEIMDALGRAQVAAGDHQRAVSTFKNLAGLQPSNPMHELRLADAYRAVGDNDGAAAALKRALRLQPDLALAKRGLALLALSDKRPQDALAIAREMQKSGAKEVGSQINGYALEGEIEALSKNWDAAAAAYRAVVLRQRSPDAVLRLHNALLAGRKSAEADRLAADWLKDNPQDAAFHYYLGDIALAKGDLAEAERHYREVLQLQPRNALALNNVAWLLLKQGKTGALPLAQQAALLMPNKAPVLDTLSLALEADNQLAPAVEAQRQATRYAPDDGRLSLRLARLYVKQGDKTRARAELEALAKLGEGFAAQAEVTSMLKAL